MALFFLDAEERAQSPYRAVGFARYREVLEGSFKEFFLVSFLALISLLPFAAGMTYAVLSASALVMIPVSLAGGALSGPFLACMYDLILRRLRDDLDDWWLCWKKSMRQNWKAALLPGAVQGLFLGVLIFSGAMLLLWAEGTVSLGTLGLLLMAALLGTIILSVWWPQVVLFDQKPGIQLKNCLLFLVLHLWRSLGAAAVQVVFWLLMFLLLPWSGLVVPFLGVWYILFLALFILYRPLDQAFRIEEQFDALQAKKEES